MLMETIYLALIIVLFGLAISDLIVGVSNDAVNFLNSAIGSKVAPLKVIMVIAALGIIIGATFSSGMMEVARKGIFHPQHFFFSEIIIIFLAVMLTDVILLDTFNTFGMPTSTTVSIVFELLGAAVAISVLKIYNDPNALEIGQYINSGKALAIISGILLSVVISFTVGALVQYITRLVFTFNYEKSLKYYGAIWGGIAITAITYFILVKGAKGSSFMSGDTKDFIQNSSFRIIAISFAGWTFILYILTWLTRINILKLIVLVGTFALAMAFAGNDLVNFIGVPLAGYESYKSFMATPGAIPDAFLMKDLAGQVKTPTMFLLIAGIVMVVTLWTSKKARTVTKTEINLARQGAGQERFGSSVFARSLVRNINNISKNFGSIVPENTKKKIAKRFEQKDTHLKQKQKGPNAPYFDLLRASVNLVVASILISLATSMKLPLSTTYVTFMVAMGTSMSDRAWGRESAVYRITGVFSVIGGWFFTAFFAFSAAFLMAMFIYYGNFIAIFILIVIAVFIVFRTHVYHKRKTSEEEKKESGKTEVLTGSKITIRCATNVNEVLQNTGIALSQTIEGLEKEDFRSLKRTYRMVREINNKTKSLKDNVSETVRILEEGSIETGHFYVQVIDYLREIAHSINFIITPSLKHIDNNHKTFVPAQFEELHEINDHVTELLGQIIEVINSQDYQEVASLIDYQQQILKSISLVRKKHVKRIKGNEVGTKNSILYLDLLAEIKNLTLYSINLLKSHRDFVLFVNGNYDKVMGREHPKT